MSTAMQIGFDGTEVPHAHVLAAMRHGPSALQREVLRTIDTFGIVTPSEVGRMVHASRGHCCRHADYPQRRSGVACCEYGPTDGSAVLKALAKRGLVKRLEHLRAWNRA